MSRPVTVRVYGLREFRMKAGRLSTEMENVGDEASREAAQLVVRSATNGFPTGPGRGGHAKNSIKAFRKGDAWSVQGGGPGFPYYAWLDFGGAVNKHTSKPTRRPFFKTGRFIFPAYERNRSEFRRIMERALARGVDRSGLG